MHTFKYAIFINECWKIVIKKKNNKRIKQKNITKENEQKNDNKRFLLTCIAVNGQHPNFKLIKIILKNIW